MDGYDPKFNVFKFTYLLFFWNNKNIFDGIWTYNDTVSRPNNSFFFAQHFGLIFGGSNKTRPVFGLVKIKPIKLDQTSYLYIFLKNTYLYMWKLAYVTILYMYEMGSCVEL